MNPISVFSYETQEIRTVIIDGEPWWVAKDVCSILGLSDVAMSLQRLDNDEKGTNTIGTPGGMQTVSIINESGLYSLILTSRKPEAKSFKKWITSEVIPSIRRSGMYSITNPNLPDFTNPAIAARAWADQFERADTAERLLDEAKPKIKFYEDVASSKTALPMELVAKVIGKMGRNTLFKLLREKGILRENNVPYQEYVDRGWFRVVETSFTKPTGEVAISVKTLVYQKGVEAITKIVEGVA